MSERWSGLKGKPESANTGVLFKKHGHRFPGAGYNTFHDRVLKEQRGYERLVRAKINELFSAPDDEAALEAAQAASASPRSARGKFPSLNGSNTVGMTTSIMSNRPQSAVSYSPRKPQPSNERNAAPPPTINTNVPYNKVLPPRPDSQAGRRTLLVSSDGLAHLEAKKMRTLSDMNQKRLANIWPQVAEGWDDHEVQETLSSCGRDSDQSPLRTMTGKRPASAAAAAAAGNQQNNNSVSPRGAPDLPPEVSPRGAAASAAAAAAGQHPAFSHEVASAYNRRVRAPAVPQPFLGKRGTARQREAESTSLLLRKLADLEEEIRVQQGNRAEMQHHVQDLKAILLNQSEERKREEAPAGSMEAISAAREKHFAPGARELRNVRFAQ